jgi:RNA polymerase sigma-54 factor
MRQGQALVMTPQLLQAIKLLQLSNLELAAYVEAELERNPLLERDDGFGETQADSPVEREGASEFDSEDFDTPSSEDTGAAFDDSGPVEADWARESLETGAVAMEQSLDTGVENAFDVDKSEQTAELVAQPTSSDGLSATSWSGPGGAIDGENPDLEAYVAAQKNLRDHLAEQLSIACPDPRDRMIGHALIDAIDDSGYLRTSTNEIADRLGASTSRVESILRTIQTFDPTGVGSRDLAECLAIQLRERDRFDPAMQALVANLPLVARRDFANLRKLCGVDDEDLLDMIAEIRRLEPKPGRAYGGEPIQVVAPDVTVKPAADGAWNIELNSEGLPRVLVNQTYAARVSNSSATVADKTFLTTCLQDANWLTKSLEQRARTILKVATEIVRQQDGFFAMGVEHLRPLNLKVIADAIGMHESTISRVTSNKYLACPRGLFELKYFFTASIPSGAGGEAHSAEAVRFRIKQMIDSEGPRDVLSDDAIVAKLKEANIVIARRTVAKYREALQIPSSVERRREKTAMLQTLG